MPTTDNYLDTPEAGAKPDRPLTLTESLRIAARKVAEAEAKVAKAKAKAEAGRTWLKRKCSVIGCSNDMQGRGKYPYLCAACDAEHPER